MRLAIIREDTGEQVPWGTEFRPGVFLAGLIWHSWKAGQILIRFYGCLDTHRVQASDYGLRIIDRA
jgi:hypothetical protein